MLLEPSVGVRGQLLALRASSGLSSGRAGEETTGPSGAAQKLFRRG